VFIAVRAFDDRRRPIARTWRRVNDLLDSIGVPRVSYEHLRRLVVEHRREEDATKARRRELARVAIELSGPRLVG